MTELQQRHRQRSRLAADAAVAVIDACVSRRCRGIGTSRLRAHIHSLRKIMTCVIPAHNSTPLYAGKLHGSSRCGNLLGSRSMSVKQILTTFIRAVAASAVILKFSAFKLSFSFLQSFNWSVLLIYMSAIN